MASSLAMRCSGGTVSGLVRVRVRVRVQVRVGVGVTVRVGVRVSFCSSLGPNAVSILR